MKQLLNHLATGRVELVELPDLQCEPNSLLIRSRSSLVSQGTERMLIAFGRSSLLQKARSQPEKVRQVLGKIKSDGLLPTIDAVFRRLDEPMPLGYCNAGEVIGIGSKVTGFLIGDRVASNGPHAELVSVPANLCARIPSEVSNDAAAFTVLGAIGLQGIRLVRPELGETVVVIGLGLIGQLTAQLLQAAGCRVVGFDFDRSKVEVAARFGITAVVSGGEVDPVHFVMNATNGLGADAVIITASTSSNDVISQSAKMSRKRGRIVLVGVVGLSINRSDFYDKELTFQVSCSYGPGRYEDAYEDKGYDYPPAFVRWTENRNFQAVLQAISMGRLQVEPLITRKVPFERYNEIYDNMDAGGLASLLVYGAPKALPNTDTLKPGSANQEGAGGDPSWGAVTTIKVCERIFAECEAPLAIVGAGNFTKMTVMPALAEMHAAVKTIVSAGGVSGTSLAQKYKVPFSSTDFAATVSDPEIRGVIITTRHNLHAEQIVSALNAGKHVLVEKPLCLTIDELCSIEGALTAEASSSDSRVTENRPTLSVGYNRRYSPHVQKMKQLLCDVGGPISVVATMNVGAIPLNHWVHDPEVGGGRLIGEACHFVDLAIFLTGSLVEAISATMLANTTDTASILLRHTNGSTSVVNYFANGHRELSKERIETHAAGRSLVLDNFRELVGFGYRSFSKQKTRQDKGHAHQFGLFAERVKAGGPALIPWPEVRNSTLATLAIPRALAERRWIELHELA